MLARRVIALSPDKAFAKQLGTALRAAGGAVEVHNGLDALGRGEIQAALIAVHADGELADVIPNLASRLAGDGKIIAVLPKCDLDRTIKIMNTADRVAGVLIAEHLKSGDLAAMATRILAGDIFGLEKTVPWGTKIYSQLVGDYQEKSVCIAQISEFAETMGVRRKYREAIEQVVDEMLMNALYDAPVDDQGKQLFAEIPTKTRISLRMEQKVVVQYACDDRTFAISVRDSYGTLDRGTVVRYIDKCLHSPEQIDRKTGGAGLGLYLMANSSTRMFFNVLPGVATEAVCSFDLDGQKVQLQKFGFFHERIDAAGRLAAGPSRLLPQGMSHPVERRSRNGPAPVAAKAPGAVIAALSMAIVLLLVLIGLVAYPRLRKTPTGSIRVATTPGATVEVGGKVRGVAGPDGTLVVDGLDVGRGYRVSVRLAHFKPAETLAEPDAEDPTEVVLPLSAEIATVTIETDPSDAAVVDDAGKALGRTPLTWTDFAPGTSVVVVLSHQGYADEKVTIRVPEGGGASTVSKQLQTSANIASLRITSDPPGAVVFLDGQRQAGAVTPTDEILVEADRKHTVRLELDGYMPATVAVTPAQGARSLPVTATLERAVSLSVAANLEARVTISGVPDCEKVALPVSCRIRKGKHQVKIEPLKMAGKIVRDVTITDADVKLDVAFGVVVPPPGHKLIVGGRAVDRAAFEVGKRVLVTIRDAEGVSGQVEVKPVAGKTVEAQ